MTAPAAHTLRAEPDTPLRTAWLGTVGYRDAYELQHRLVADRQADRRGDVLLLLEHPRVYTLGRRADRSNVRLDAAELVAKGIEVVDVDRGGDVTYHGPGQLVGYPILKLRGTRVVDHVRALEEVLIRTVAGFGITGERSPGYSGVWVDDAKIAAIGVRVAAGGVTSHGFALNVTTDLDDFAGIVPCGIVDRGVCSLASLGVDTDLDTVAGHLTAAVADVYGATLEAVGPDAFAPTTTPTEAPP